MARVTARDKVLAGLASTICHKIAFIAHAASSHWIGILVLCTLTAFAEAIFNDQEITGACQTLVGRSAPDAAGNHLAARDTFAVVQVISVITLLAAILLTRFASAAGHPPAIFALSKPQEVLGLALRAATRRTLETHLAETILARDAVFVDSEITNLALVASKSVRTRHATRVHVCITLLADVIFQKLTPDTGSSGHCKESKQNRRHQKESTDNSYFE